ncbi:unnamed protein product, partial [Ectocarpus sp. 12 AP-2014]
MGRKEASRRRTRSTLIIKKHTNTWSGGGFPRGTNMHHRRRTSQRLWAWTSYVR